MSTVEIGAVLPTAMDELTDGASPGVTEAARAVEESGLESLWVADLVLGDGTPALEPISVLAAAAAVTERVRLGFGVLSLPPRPVSWLAAQIATVQHGHLGGSACGIRRRLRAQRRLQAPHRLCPFRPSTGVAHPSMRGERRLGSRALGALR